jgi:hypothetical protein
MVYNENVRNSLVAVSTTSVLLSTAKRRSEIVITNTSTAAQNITLSFGTEAVATYGVLLAPFTSYFASNTQGFNVWEGEIFSIASAINGQVSIFER